MVADTRGGEMSGGEMADGESSAGEMNLPRILLVGNFLSRHVATRTVGEELAERLADDGWQVAATSGMLPRLTRLLDMQRTIWSQGPFAVAQVDVYSGPAFLWAEAACWSLRWRATPYVLTLHGGKLPEFAARWPRRVRRLLAGARVVTTPSPYLFEAMAPYLPSACLREDVAPTSPPKDRRRLRMLPNPLDLAAYPFTLRRDLQPRLVWLRAFHRIYNPELAPRVLARLGPQATLAMVGPDKGDGSLERARRRAEDLGVAERVTFTGGVPKSAVPQVLARHDVFVNTSDADNAPVSVTEAMACGLCVVSTDAGGLSDLLTGGEDALLVPRGDAAAMAAAVERLLGDPELAARLSANGRRLAEDRDWSKVLPQWQEILLDVARAPAEPR